MKKKIHEICDSLPMMAAMAILCAITMAVGLWLMTEGADQSTRELGVYVFFGSFLPPTLCMTVAELTQP